MIVKFNSYKSAGNDSIGNFIVKKKVANEIVYRFTKKNDNAEKFSNYCLTLKGYSYYAFKILKKGRV